MMPNPGGNTWQPMSADEVRRAPLRESGLGRRGYRPEDVDRLRNHVAAELERWARAYADAEEEVHRLRDYYRRQGIDTGTPNRSGHDDAVSPDAVHIMARAQAYADQLVAEAQAQARHVQADARTQAESIVSQARREADRAGHAYRARVGEAYSADREETERLAAWARSILATMQAVQHQLGTTAEAFALELAKFGPGASRQHGPVQPPAHVAPIAAQPPPPSPFD